MSKAEIIAELPHLSPEERAEVRARLDQLELYSKASGPGNPGMARLRTPRLANPAEAADFKKRVTELPGHASL